MSTDPTKQHPLREGFIWNEVVYNGQASTWDAMYDKHGDNEYMNVEWRGDYDPAYLSTRRGYPDIVLAVLEVNAPQVFAEHDRAVVVTFAARVHEWKNSAEASLEFEGYNGQFAEQEFDCVACGGEGWTDLSDDEADEVDAVGEGPCEACNGTGVEPIEGRLNRGEWMDEQVLRHARGERTMP